MFRGELLCCLPRRFVLVLVGVVSGIVDALLVTYILLAIYLAEVNDIGKYVEMNLFI